MEVSAKMVARALERTIEDQERLLAKLVEREDWREAGDKAAYLDGLRYAATMVDMLRLNED